jgi:hypothetical protein
MDLEAEVVALKKRVDEIEALLKELTPPEEPDPLVVGTDTFRQMMKAKKQTL